MEWMRESLKCVAKQTTVQYQVERASYSCFKQGITILSKVSSKHITKYTGAIKKIHQLQEIQ